MATLTLLMSRLGIKKRLHGKVQTVLKIVLDWSLLNFVNYRHF